MKLGNEVSDLKNDVELCVMIMFSKFGWSHVRTQRVLRLRLGVIELQTVLDGALNAQYPGQSHNDTIPGTAVRILSVFYGPHPFPHCAVEHCKPYPMRLDVGEEEVINRTINEFKRLMESARSIIPQIDLSCPERIVRRFENQHRLR